MLLLVFEEQTKRPSKSRGKMERSGLFPVDSVENNVASLQTAFMARFCLSIQRQAEEQAGHIPRWPCGGGGGGLEKAAGGLGSLSPECLPRGASWEALRSPFKGHGVASRTAASGRCGVPQRRPRPEGSLRGRGCRCRAYSSGGPGKWLSPGPACSPSPLGPENRRRRSAACRGPAAQTGADSQWSSRRPEPGWRPRALRRQRWGATPLSTAEPRLGTAGGGPAHAPGRAVWERAGSLTRHAGGFSGSRPTGSAWCLTRRAR